MKLILIAAKYLKRYPVLTAGVLSLIILASFFEGASLGMLIPLVQSMTGDPANILAKIPFMSHPDSLYSSLSRTKIVSLVFIALFLLMLVKNVFVYLSNIFVAKLRFSMIRDIRSKLMANLLEYDSKFFDGIKTGYIISNFNTDTQRMGDFIHAVLQLTALSGRVAAYLALLFFISWKASIVIFLLIACVSIPIELIMKKVKNIGECISKSLADYNYRLTEILGGLRLIKGTGSEDMEKESFRAKADAVSGLLYRCSKYAQLVIPFTEIFIFCLVSIYFLILVNVARIDITTAFPLIATYLLVLGRTLTQLNAMNGSRSDAMHNLGAFESYEKLCDERGKRTIKSGDKTIEKFSDSIEFQDVTFAYLEGRDVLKNISIRMPRGKITAFVGASGAGKSTAVNLIPRFYDVISGKILVDGINLKDIELKGWRRKIGFVSQDIFIFNISVKNNISYGHPGISDEEVAKAAQAANAHDFIINLSNGYDTILGERGIKLSGGQKQRIAIARAIIHNPEVLILDEATSSLDTETETLITQALDRLTKNRTVIAIAHRLSTILHADNIIVLDKGRVAEEGSHAELINREGLYRKLYDMQFRIRQGVSV